MQRLTAKLSVVKGAAERAALTEEAAREVLVKAHAHRDATTREYNAAVQASIEAGATGGVDALRKAMRQADDLVADAEAQLAAVREARDGAERRRKADLLEGRWKLTADLCEQKHAKHAARIDVLLQDIGKEWADMMEAIREISRAVPEVPGLRLGKFKHPASIVNPWEEAMVSGFVHSLCLVTNGTLGERKGFQSVQEMQRDGVPKLEDLARALHRRILIRQGGKPIAKTLVPEDGEFDGPRAA